MSPAQCAVLLGLGLDPRDIAAERDVPGTFASLLPNDPAVRVRFADVAGHVNDALADVRTLGAVVPSSRPDVIGPVTLDQVAAAARWARVLVFITHHDGERGLQFGAQMAPAGAVLEAIGHDYDGVIDLGACRTKVAFASLVRDLCPEARALLHDDLHRLDVRVSIVRAIQRCLLVAPRPYLEVATDVLAEMAQQSQHWSES